METMNKTELLNKCKELGIKKYASKNKSQLIELINGKQMINIKSDNIVTNTKSDNTVNLLDILNKLLKKYSLKTLSDMLNLASGTITRWIELNDIPKNYEFDLLKLSDIKIIYSNYSSKQKDQFFTPEDTAKYCFQIFCKEIEKFNEDYNDFTYIEPSAGDGRFLKALPADKTIAMDIEPKNINIMEEDYLDWKPNTNHSKYVVFGNPPFGLRGHMALKFINHSYEFAEYVCFILPQLFESDGKGVPRKRVKGFNLIYSTKLYTNFYEPNGNEIKINTIFQIWSKNHSNDSYEIKEYTNDTMKIFSMSDGGTIPTTRNKDMIGKCDIYIPSTCFGKENMKCYNNFEDLPGKKGYGIVFYQNKKENIDKMTNIHWSDIAFLSTNSAYNLRSSQIYSLFNG
jgi:predicted RNA methylase